MIRNKFNSGQFDFKFCSHFAKQIVEILPIMKWLDKGNSFWKKPNDHQDVETITTKHFQGISVKLLVFLLPEYQKDSSCCFQ